jgi:hypothetical protein
MRNCLAIFFLAAVAAWAQNVEIGATYGTAGFATAHGRFVAAGAEVCLKCGARFVYFADYSHWWLTPPVGQTSKLDLVTGGLRVQGKNPYVRPFVDLGVAVGHYDGHPHDAVHKDENFGIAGAALGVGVTLSPVKHIYIRPEAKLVLATETVVGQAGVGIGIRF